MSSPGIRYVNLARVLAAALPDAKVTLAVPEVHAQPGAEAFNVTYYKPEGVLSLAQRHDVVIAMSFPLPLLFACPFFRRPLLVLDFFSQFHIEWMEVGRDLYTGFHRRVWTRVGQIYANLQLMVADYVLCANERQRDSYLGVLASLGLLPPATYDRDTTLRRLIDVAPHGIRPEPLPSGRRPVKGVYPGIEAGDKLILWLGGILYWYDPVTLLRALARVRQRHPEVKLLFLGSVYPGGMDLGQGVRFREAVAETKRLGLWQNGVYFHTEWLPYEEVVDYLLDADFSVTTYFTNAETRYAHRTRFLDFIWARLPIVCTEGDVLADEVTARSWGITVRERDEDGLAAALLRLVEDEEFARTCRENLAAAAESLSWEAAFEPLIRFCARRGGPQSIAEPRHGRVLALMRSNIFYVAARLFERAVATLSSRRG